MKKILIHYVVFSLLLITLFSCSKKNDTVVATPSTSSIIVQGNWKITYFNDSGADSTSKYSSYTLSFTAGGSVAAFNTLLAVNGTWSSYNDDGRNNLLLNFVTSFSTIAMLTHDWHIVEKTSIKIRMEDVSGGGSGTDYLTIEKI